MRYYRLVNPLGDLLDWRESFPFRDYLPGC
jgi:hypothetical protein